MTTWIEKLERQLFSSSQNHTLFIDRDELFNYAELRHSIQAHGYKIIRAGSTLDVRIQYELKVRGSQKKIILVAPAGYQPLSDIKQRMYVAEVGFANLFPNLAVPPLQGLGFNELCTLSNMQHYTSLGEAATLRFLLENLYGVDFDALHGNKKKESTLAILIAVLLDGKGTNQAITDYLAALAKPHFPGLIKEDLSTEKLLAFLQQEWNEWVANGDTSIDFSWPILNRPIGNLFLNRRLEPVLVSQKVYAQTAAVQRIGLAYDQVLDHRTELESRINHLRAQIIQVQDVHDDWHQLAISAGMAFKDALSLNDRKLMDNLQKTINSLNERFQLYLDQSYDSAFSLSGIRKPFIVSRMLDHIAAKPRQRKALIVLDGISFWQWQLLADVLRQSGIETDTSVSMAFIPTITAWSRQAIFRGNRPDMNTTNAQEAKLFFNYWEDKGYHKQQIQFTRFSAQQPFCTVAISDQVSVLAMVCNDLDEIAHHSSLGLEQLYQSTQQWAAQANFATLIQELKQAGFSVFITTDHGNVLSKGIGNLGQDDKVGALSRGKRHLHFTSEKLRDDVVQKLSEQQVGIRGFSVYLKDEAAFIQRGIEVITHGGSHFWEVLIPFVTI